MTHHSTQRPNQRPNQRRTHLIAPLLALALIPALAACGSDDDTKPEQTGTIAASEDFNQADVDFATAMIQHHAQALSMVDLTDGRKLSPELTALAEQIRMAQGPEIETMVDWLTDWDQPIPATMRDHVNADSDHDMSDMGDTSDMPDMGHDMPGMMTPEDLAALADAKGAAFETTWLEMMIEHHEGAIEMAEDETAEGEYVDATDLAQQIIDTQQTEIDTMQGLLDS